MTPSKRTDPARTPPVIALVLLLLSGASTACGAVQRPTFGPPTTAGTSSETVPLAAELRRKILTALRTVRTVHAEVVTISTAVPGDPKELRFEVLETDRGDFVELHPGVGGMAYLRAQQQFWSWTTSDESVHTITEVAPGPPDFRTQPGSQAPVHLARLALSLEGPSVTETRHDDRAAWVVQGPAVAFGGDHVAVTVDQETGLGVRAQATAQAVPVHELNVKRLETNHPVSEADLRASVPPGEPSQSRPMGFQRTSLEKVAAAAGYRPFLPSSLPTGYALDDLAVAAVVGRAPGETLTPDREVVSAAYRRGLDRIVVSNRRVDTGLGLLPPGNEKDRVSGGALDRSDAYVVREGGPFGEEWTVRTVIGDRAVFVMGPDRDDVVFVGRALASSG